MNEEHPTQPLFSEAEWDDLVAKVATDMKAFLRPYRTPVFRNHGDHAEALGSGSYLRLGESIFVLTNQHVAGEKRAGQSLGHQFLNDEGAFPIIGNHHEGAWPLDLALLPVSSEIWTSRSHDSRAIIVEQIAVAHAPAPTELLTFTGFGGENVNFHYGTLISRGSCHTSREAQLPGDDRFDDRFHFGLDYHPDKARQLDARELPLPPGLSGSVVWNTRLVEARTAGMAWTPELAQVTGVIWAWVSSVGCLVATRSEYLRSYLLGAVSSFAAAESED